MELAVDTAASTALALAAVLHAGFQTSVTVLAYPALVRVGLDRPEDWRVAHDRHSRAIVPLVGVVYVLLLGTGVWSLSSGPSVLDLATLAGAWGAVLITGTAAAPTHGRLTTPEPALLRRLVVADRWRCGAAIVGAVAGVTSAILR